MKYSKIDFDKKKVYEVVVIANTSSGKSALINSLIGEKILLSKNKSCTARNLRIIDSDKEENVVAHVLWKNGTYSKIRNHCHDLIEKFNGTKEIKDLILECNFIGVENLQKSLVIVDTPGPNNSLDNKHYIEANSYISNIDEGLILFVFNANQPCTYDDEKLLNIIYKKTKDNSRIKVLFAINKIDEIDVDKENPLEIVQICSDFIKKIGFTNIDLISVSAKAALIFKQALAGKDLNKDEIRSFDDMYQTFCGSNYNYNELCVISGEINTEKIIKINGNSYTYTGIQAALNNTGITNLIEIINSKLIETLCHKPVKVKKTKENRSV